MNLVETAAIVSSIALSLIAGGSLYLSILTFLKNRSNVRAIYLSIFPAGFKSSSILDTIIPTNDFEITVSNIGQRTDSIIGITVELEGGTIIPIQSKQLPLILNENIPEKIGFRLLQEKTFQVDRILLTTGAKKEITVKRKWVNAQIKNLKSFCGDKHT